MEHRMLIEEIRQRAIEEARAWYADRGPSMIRGLEPTPTDWIKTADNIARFVAEGTIPPPSGMPPKPASV